jgi:hypothetical protein
MSHRNIPHMLDSLWDQLVSDMDDEMTHREMGEISVVQYTINCLSTQLAQVDNGYPVMPPCSRCGFPTGHVCETCIEEELFLPSWRGYAVSSSLLFKCTPLCSVCDAEFMCCQFHVPSLQEYLVSIWTAWEHIDI